MGHGSTMVVTSPRSCYAESGTEKGYGGTRQLELNRRVLFISGAALGSARLSSYAVPTEHPVLRCAVLLTTRAQKLADKSHSDQDPEHGGQGECHPLCPTDVHGAAEHSTAAAHVLFSLAVQTRAFSTSAHAPVCVSRTLSCTDLLRSHARQPSQPLARHCRHGLDRAQDQLTPPCPMLAYAMSGTRIACSIHSLVGARYVKSGTGRPYVARDVAVLTVMTAYDARDVRY
eukprot:3618115-Rhodomonas_salina.1